MATTKQTVKGTLNPLCVGMFNHNPESLDDMTTLSSKKTKISLHVKIHNQKKNTFSQTVQSVRSNT